MRTVHADRYLSSFRRGGSVPALVEADDLGIYVVKLRCAAQGPNALVAELVAGEVARAAGLLVPEIVLVRVDPGFARAEPDPELSIPIEKSAGINLGLDWLPGSVMFDPRYATPDATTASRIVAFDALVLNVDRTAKNPNILRWHRRFWLIDHGAALWFHHGWGPETRLASVDDPFHELRAHVLLPWATELPAAAEHVARSVAGDVLDRIVAEVPVEWLAGTAAESYADWIRTRASRLGTIVAALERVA